MHRLPALHTDSDYARWRAAKLADCLTDPAQLIVDVNDPTGLSPDERQALLQRCARWNMALYRSPRVQADKALPKRLGEQLGLHRLDANWLADEDGISPIEVAAPGLDRADFIPYTARPIKWHTDGYYHPGERKIRAMVLHCVRPAASGGVNALMDHELAYIAVRDANPAWLAALEAPDAMTIPERVDDEGVARPAQSGPVFSWEEVSGALHMRYTARKRSVQWKDDPATQAAAAFLARWLDDSATPVLRLCLQSGMGLVCNNVLHDRSGFSDAPDQPRLLYRARYLDHIAHI